MNNNELRIPLGPVLKSAKEEAERTLLQSADRGARAVVDELMREPHYWREGGVRKSDKGGVVYQMLQEKIDSYALSDEFEARVQAMIERHMDAEADAVVRAMLNSAARKRVFTAVPHK